jgi:hypothetical protein
VVSVTPRPRFSPGERTSVPIVQEAGWAPDAVWTQRLEEKYSLSLLVIELRSTGRPVRSQDTICTNWTTPAPELLEDYLKIR